MRGRSGFDRLTEVVSDIVSSATFFAISPALVLSLPTIILFASVDTWQLVINTATSILAFLLVALLQTQAPDRQGGAAVADLLEAQLGRGDPDAQAHQVRELREAIRLEGRRGQFRAAPPSRSRPPQP